MYVCVLGLKRLEYRGYDSAGVGVDAQVNGDILLVKKQGKVAALQEQTCYENYIKRFIFDKSTKMIM